MSNTISFAKSRVHNYRDYVHAGIDVWDFKTQVICSYINIKVKFIDSFHIYWPNCNKILHIRY